MIVRDRPIVWQLSLRRARFALRFKRGAEGRQQTCGQSGAIVERRESRAAEVSDKTGNALCR
jgi:hypothetical protein